MCCFQTPMLIYERLARSLFQSTTDVSFIVLPADEVSLCPSVCPSVRQSTDEVFSVGKKINAISVDQIGIGTVETPYNTVPYITGSNIARLGHGSQNSWSKLWIPIMKSAPVRVIFMWKSVPKKSIHGSSDIFMGTQWKQQRHDSPWSYRSDIIVTFLWYGTIGIIWHHDHQSTTKKV